MSLWKLRSRRMFPTRRSSDLLLWCRVAHGAGHRPAADRLAQRLAGGRGEQLGVPQPARRCASRRSEEHTSELQSRGPPVCRLLLEKNKTHRELAEILQDNTDA